MILEKNAGEQLEIETVVYRKVIVRVGKGYPELTPWALQWLDQIRKLYHLNRQRANDRNPVVGRKNDYGSGSEWSGRLAMMLFSIFATLGLWKINPLRWLTWYFEACATGGSKPAQHNVISARPSRVTTKWSRSHRSRQPKRIAC